MKGLQMVETMERKKVVGMASWMVVAKVYRKDIY